MCRSPGRGACHPRSRPRTCRLQHTCRYPGRACGLPSTRLHTCTSRLSQSRPQQSRRPRGHCAAPGPPSSSPSGMRQSARQGCWPPSSTLRPSSLLGSAARQEQAQCQCTIAARTHSRPHTHTHNHTPGTAGVVVDVIAVRVHGLRRLPQTLAPTLAPAESGQPAFETRPARQLHIPAQHVLRLCSERPPPSREHKAAPPARWK